MKLQSVQNGRIIGSHHRTVYEGSTVDSFAPIGSISNPGRGVAALSFATVTRAPGRSVLEWMVGAYQTTNVWPVGDTALIATVGRHLFSSQDGGVNWHFCRKLPSSSGLFGVLPTALCRHDGAVYLGEYPLDSSATPHVLRSVDDGRTWRRFLSLPEVRHIHSIAVDPYTESIWLSTGDRDTECHIGRIKDGRFEPVVGGDQRFRAVDLVFTPDALLWGMDCLYTERNSIFRLDRQKIPAGGPAIGTPPTEISADGGTPLTDQTLDAIKTNAPEPQPVTTVGNSVYYGTTIHDGSTVWAVFSTAIEAGGDSTAPTATDEAFQEPTATVVAAPADTDFTEWQLLARFGVRRCPVQYLNPGGRLPCANAYVFLGAENGTLYCNPFNTKQQHGAILTIEAESFDDRLLGQSR